MTNVRCALALGLPLAIASACGGGSSPAPQAPQAPPSASSAAASTSGSAASPAPVGDPRLKELPLPALVEVTVLDTNERAPKRLPIDPAFVRGASGVLRELARCRAKAGSKGHWVHLEWRVDEAGKATKVVAHQVHVPPAPQPRPLADEALRCMEASAASPAFVGAKVGAVARVFALVGFDLPEGETGARTLGHGDGFYPEEDGGCRLEYTCPADKRCAEPPRVRCPRVASPP